MVVGTGGVGVWCFGFGVAMVFGVWCSCWCSRFCVMVTLVFGVDGAVVVGCVVHRHFVEVPLLQASSKKNGGFGGGVIHRHFVSAPLL